MQNPEQNLGGVNPEPIKGEVPDTMEVFYSELGDELFRKNITTLNDTLRQLLTTSTALMGGGMVFLDAKMCETGFRFAALVMFFLSVCISLLGIHPYRDSAHLGMPYEIKANVEAAIWWKDGFVYACSIFLAVGLLLAFVGVLLKT